MRRLALLALFSLLPTFAVDPNVAISQYAHTAWRVRDGALRNRPFSIAQTSDGRIWIGTEAGLYFFDGMQFHALQVPNLPQELRQAIYSLYGSADGALWIGSAGGLFRYQHGKVEPFPSIKRRINGIVGAPDGGVWISRSRVTNGNGPLCYAGPGGARCYGVADGMPCHQGVALAKDPKGGVWIGATNEACFFDPARPQASRRVVAKLDPTLAGIGGLAVGPDDTVWAGSVVAGPGLGLFQVTPEGPRPFSVAGFKGDEFAINALAIDRNGALWLADARYGIFRILGPQVERFSTQDGLTSNMVDNFFEDREGNLWAATSQGVDRWRNFRVVTWSQREGLKQDEIASVTTAPDDSIWVSTFSTIDRIVNGHVERGPDLTHLQIHQVTSIRATSDGSIWLGTDQGLVQVNPGQAHIVPIAPKPSLRVPMSMAESTDHDLWVLNVGPRRGLIRLREGHLMEDIPDQRVPVMVSIAPDPGGGIWIGRTKGYGAARYRNGQLRLLTDPSLTDSAIHDLWSDQPEAFYGASTTGLVRWKDGHGRRLGEQDGLPCENIRSLMPDRLGSLWLSGDCGLMAIRLSDLDEWWNRRLQTVPFRHLDVFDGALGGGSAFSPLVTRDSQGRLWYALPGGVQRVDPAHLAGNPHPPPVTIEQVIADRQTFPVQSGVLLPPHTRDLQINYTALSYSVPERIQFRYRLDGRDADWQDAQGRRQAFYNDLPPGDYRFQVIAANEDGVWNRTGAALQFTVAAAFYQTWWFRASLALAFLGAIWALYQWRIRQVSAQLTARLNDRLAERTRLARDLHDTLLQTIQSCQMVASSTLDQTSPEVLRSTLERLSRWLELASREGRAVLISLRHSTVQTNQLAEALEDTIDDCLVDRSLDFRVSTVGTPRELHPIARDEVYRIGVEAIRNACAHGAATQLRVELVYQHGITLRVRDNGVGMAPELLKDGRDGHFGLKGMRERAARLGGKLIIESDPGHGTEVRLEVPAPALLRTAPSWLRRIFGRLHG